MTSELLSFREDKAKEGFFKNLEEHPDKMISSDFSIVNCLLKLIY